MDNSKCIGVLDSGIGGISLLNELKQLLPNEKYIYIADRKYMPYGNKTNRQIKKRLNYLIENYLYETKSIVLACNTATNVGIDYLRKKYTIPIIGVEPAIKPAVKYSDGKILVLTTVLTSKQKKFLKLCKYYGQNRLKILALSNLASDIEKYDIDHFRPLIKELLDENNNYNAIVLGCTHYTYLKPIIKDVSANIKIFDGIFGTANRLKLLLEDKKLLNNDFLEKKEIKYIFTDMI